MPYSSKTEAILAKPPAPATSYELEATDILARFMRAGKREHQLWAAIALVIASALTKNGNGKANGNGHGK